MLLRLCTEFTHKPAMIFNPTLAAPVLQTMSKNTKKTDRRN
jgi:hypothetical protein